MLLSGSLATTARAAEADEQRALVQKFLVAYFCKHNDELKGYLPNDYLEMFGPYPFKELHLVEPPKVHTNQAVMEFTATPVDGHMPAKGGFLFYRKTGVWLMRQVLYYQRVPRIFRLPDHSVTDSDRAEEYKVRIVANDFLKAWREGDKKEMERYSYDWTNRDDDPINIKVFKSTMTLIPTNWGDTLARYNVRASYQWGIFSYSMTINGGLVLMKDEGNWRVRANQMIMDF